MATTDVSICNEALAHIGTRSTITALNDGSTEANACNLVYTDTRDQLLSMAHWNFAKKTDVLGNPVKSAPGTPTNPSTATQWSNAFPPPPWLYEYALPTDAIQMRYVVPQIDTGFAGVPIFSTMTGFSPYSGLPMNAVRFELASDLAAPAAGTVVLTNQYQAIGCWTTRITDPTLFANQFVEALACAVAGKIAQQLTGDRALRIEMLQLANAKVIEARASDGNEGLTVIDTPADWITARDSVNPWVGPGYIVAPYGPLFPVGI